MASMKTAISVDGQLLKRVTRCSKRLRMSRSRFFAKAAAEYLKQFDRESLKQAINRAYEDGLDASEKQSLKSSRRKFAKVVRDEPW